MKRLLFSSAVIALIIIVACNANAQVVSTSFSYQYGADGTLSITGYTGQSGDMNVPMEIEGRRVTSIANEAFRDNGQIKRAFIPEGVTSIGRSAFQGANNLTEILLPSTLRTIEASAFNSCGKLKRVSIPKGISLIPESSFSFCRELEEVNLPLGLKAIEEMAFAVTKLNNIDIPLGVETIGKHAFYGNESLVEIIIPDSVNRIEEYAFFVCKNLKNVVLPTGLQSISSGVFDKCSSLETIAIPMTVNNIKDDAFFTETFKPKNLKILGPSGSEAERFARRTNLPFESIPTTNYVSIRKGDQDITDKRLAIDLSSQIEPIRVVAITQPDSLWPGVIWTSSNPTVASVDLYGIVLGVKKGEATISAVAVDGGKARASFQVNVANLAKEVFVSGDSTLYSKGKVTLKADVLPSTADNKDVDWMISDSAIASINAQGVVTASDVNAKKTVTITARTKDGSDLISSYVMTIYPLISEMRIFHNNVLLENKEELTIDLMQDSNKIQLIVNNLPTDSIQKINWKSSSDKVATVDEDGLIVGLSKGRTQINGITIDGTKKAISFTVNVANLIKEINITGDNTVASQQKLKLSAIILPENASNKKLEWFSSDENIAKVNKNSGEVTARKTDIAKKVTITAVALDGSDVIAEFDVNIYPLATGINFSWDGYLLENKEVIGIDLAERDSSIQLGAVIEPIDAMQSITWKSSEERVASVDKNGLVVGLSKGQSKISATTTDGTKKTISFTVNVANLIREISVTGDNVVAAEQKLKLSAIILPENASNKKLEWRSSDENIARVNKNTGEMTARKTDVLTQVTITAVAMDGSGITTEFDVIVHPLATRVVISRDGYALENKEKLSIDLAAGESSIQLAAAIEPIDAIQEIKWKSSDERFVTVDENGLVKAIKKGKVILTATAADGSRVRASCELLVSNSKP